MSKRRLVITAVLSGSSQSEVARRYGVTQGCEEDVQSDEKAWRGIVSDLGLEIPDAWTVKLVEAKYDAEAWGPDSLFSEWPDADEREAKGQSRHTKTPAPRSPVWR